MKRYIWSVMALAFVANASEFVVVSEIKNDQRGIEKKDAQKSDMKKSDVQKIERKPSKGKRSRNLNFELIKVREGNSTRNMVVPIEEREVTTLTRASALESKLNSKDGFLIVFVDDRDIKAFEIRFNVKLKEKLQIGYYIFENHSKFSDIELMNTILASSEGKNIETIKPNWKMQMTKF